MNECVEAISVTTGPLALRARLAAYAELTKARIGVLVLIATAVGFQLSLPDYPIVGTWTLLVHTLIGTALTVAGANALNQWWEVGHDRQMARTEHRPLPSGRLAGAEALAFAIGCAVVGVTYLAAQVNGLSSLLALTAVLSYALVYTPLKRRTSACVLVGAVPGALPPVIGWAAGAGELSVGAWILFGIVFFWQLPHFAAIAWQYRDDYARAGYPMLAVIDTDGTRTNLHVVTHTVALLAVSLLPSMYRLTGTAYALGALVFGLCFLGIGIWFLAHKTNSAARLHVVASIIYLPLLLALMMIDKV